MDQAAVRSASGLHRFRFSAMNTNIEIALSCSEADIRNLEMRARGWFENVETAFSRFRPGSELCRLNRSAGRPALVSDNMLEVLLLADAYRKETEGAFNPFLLNALQNAGYGESFERMSAWKRPNEPGAPKPCRADDPPVEIDPGMRSVRLSPNTAVDLGGIAKSWAVKRLAQWLRNKRKLAQGLVNAGGDLAVWDQRKREAEPWLVAVEHPWKPDSDAGVLVMTNGAAATSSRLGRRWKTERGPMHHLIDPRTMLPSESDTVQCTVAGPDATACEVWAKSLCILGSEQGLKLFRRKAPAYEALLFTSSKKVVFAGAAEPPVGEWDGFAADRIC